MPMIDLLSLQHFHFLRPYWFIIFILMIWILRAFSLRDDTLSLWRKVMSPQILQQLTVRGNNTNWLSPQKLSLLLAIPLCIVLMGPTWQQQPSPFTENNAPLIIALDVSQTMEQNDIQPSRLLRAKQKIIELLAIRGDSNTALIAFAGSAHVVMPITNDSEMIRHFLDALDESIMPKKGKLPENILPLIDKLLTTNIPATVLLIGDGATSNTIAAFGDFFLQPKNNPQQHLQLITWAIGKSATEISSNTGSAIIPMQLSQLKKLSDNSNGRLVTMTHDKQDINQVNRYIKYNLAIIEDKSRPWHDAGYLLLFVVAVIFLFWFRKGWTLQW